MVTDCVVCAPDAALNSIVMGVLGDPVSQRSWSVAPFRPPLFGGQGMVNGPQRYTPDPDAPSSTPIVTELTVGSTPSDPMIRNVNPLQIFRTPTPSAGRLTVALVFSPGVLATLQSNAPCDCGWTRILPDMIKNYHACAGSTQKVTANGVPLPLAVADTFDRITWSDRGPMEFILSMST